jgi:hypothetical protein
MNKETSKTKEVPKNESTENEEVKHVEWDPFTGS